MKKFLYLLIGLSGFAFQSTNPDDYTYTCANESPDPNIDIWEAFFNDPDGDCVSNQWLVIYYNADGTITSGTSYTMNLCNTPPCSINFGAWDCCTGNNQNPNSDSDPYGNNGGSGNGSSGGGSGNNEPCYFPPACTECTTIGAVLDCITSCTDC
ncbi:MAG: hypothetical protein AAF433_16060 [Bacteroidota bacterium]